MDPASFARRERQVFVQVLDIEDKGPGRLCPAGEFCLDDGHLESGFSLSLRSAMA
jgi:hypothetical protein